MIGGGLRAGSYQIAVLVALAAWGGPADAEPRAFNVNYSSRATFKTEAPLETVVGATGGREALTGRVMVDPARPQGREGHHPSRPQRAQDRGKNFLDSEGNEANRWAVFEIRGVEIAGPLEVGKAMPAKGRGTLTIRGKPVETVADCTVNYVRLTPDQVETQKRFGLTAENMRVTAKFATTFTDHGTQIPQILIFKLSNDIQLETDVVLVLAP